MNERSRPEDAQATARRYGRIGGLRAHALNPPEVMLAGARRGFRERFLRLVDPDGVLAPDEAELRAARAMRAHMLTLSEKSAKARRRVPKAEETPPAAA